MAFTQNFKAGINLKKLDLLTTLLIATNILTACLLIFLIWRIWRIENMINSTANIAWEQFGSIKYPQTLWNIQNQITEIGRKIDDIEQTINYIDENINLLLK